MVSPSKFTRFLLDFTNNHAIIVDGRPSSMKPEIVVENGELLQGDLYGEPNERPRAIDITSRAGRSGPAHKIEFIICSIAQSPSTCAIELPTASCSMKKISYRNIEYILRTIYTETHTGRTDQTVRRFTRCSEPKRSQPSFLVLIAPMIARARHELRCQTKWFEAALQR